MAAGDVNELVSDLSNPLPKLLFKFSCVSKTVKFLISFLTISCRQSPSRLFVSDILVIRIGWQLIAYEKR